MHYSDRDQFPWTPYSLGRKLEDVRFLFRPASWSHARVRPARSRGWNVGPPMRGFAKKKQSIILNGLLEWKVAVH